MGPKAVYVATWRAARVAAGRVGLLARLEAGSSHTALHLRSLFAIHEVADMIRLDLPWWTYDATRLVHAHLRSRRGEARVFEYGSGASTAWLARRAGDVTSIEHDARFAEHLDSLLDPGWPVDLRVVLPEPRANPVAPSQRRGFAGLDFDRYVRAIDDVTGDFDLVVVDGRSRVACVRAALGRLSDGGLLLLDNAERREYASVVRDPSLIVHMTRGATPCLPYPTSTALIQKR